MSAMTPHSQLSSSGLTGRSSIPETSMIEAKGCGVLDAPRARGMTAMGGARSCEKRSSPYGRAHIGGGSAHQHRHGAVPLIRRAWTAPNRVWFNGMPDGTVIPGRSV
jgi:hypothetical protein